MKFNLYLSVFLLLVGCGRQSTFSGAEDEAVPVIHLVIDQADKNSDCEITIQKEHVCGVIRNGRKLTVFNLTIDEIIAGQQVDSHRLPWDALGSYLMFCSSPNALHLFEGGVLEMNHYLSYDQGSTWSQAELPSFLKTHVRFLNIVESDTGFLLLTRSLDNEFNVVQWDDDNQWEEHSFLAKEINKDETHVLYASGVCEKDALFLALLRESQIPTPDKPRPSFVLQFSDAKLLKNEITQTVILDRNVSPSPKPNFGSQKIFLSKDGSRLTVVSAAPGLNVYSSDAPPYADWTKSCTETPGRRVSSLVPSGSNERVFWKDRSRKHMPWISRTPLAFFRLNASQYWNNNDVFVRSIEGGNKKIVSLTPLYSHTEDVAVAETKTYLFMLRIGQKKVGFSYDQFKEPRQLSLSVFNQKI